MDIDNLTIKEVKEIAKIANNFINTDSEKEEGLNSQIGEKVIVRTYSAGVWFGKLIEKSSNEVILEDARRMYRFWAKKSISLSGVAVHGIKQEDSKICPRIKRQWLNAIEIISLTDVAIKSLEETKDVEAD